MTMGGYTHIHTADTHAHTLLSLFLFAQPNSYFFDGMHFSEHEYLHPVLCRRCLTDILFSIPPVLLTINICTH